MNWLMRLFGRRPRPLPAPAPAPVPVPVSRPLIGIGAHRCDDVERAWLARLGVKHVRTTYYTQEAPKIENYDLAFQLYRLDALRAMGMEPLVVVWDFAPVGDAAAVAEMARLAARYPGTLWQIGNEYDAQPWSPWHTGTTYAKLMAAVVPAMRAADPTCTIVGCGLAVTLTDDAARHARFLDAYRRAGGPVLRAWCIHTYGLPLLDRYTALTASMRAALAGWMPLWVTEFGVEAAQVVAVHGPQTAAQIDTAQAGAYAAVLNAPPSGVERVYSYQLWTDEDDGHGIVRRDGSERPACDVLRAALNRSRT